MSLITTASKYTPITQLRQNGNGIQPRFITEKPNFNSFMRFVNRVELNTPPWLPDSRERDSWLQTFWQIEPYLAGVINSVTSIDANRGWEMIGGKTLVNRWSTKLHNSGGGEGWRMFMKSASLSFWTTDINAIIGVRRDNPFANVTQDGDIVKSPMITLENIDPAMCNLGYQLMRPKELGGVEIESRLSYNGKPLAPYDYFRVASMPSNIERYNRLGYCALSRCLDLAKLLYAVYQYDHEQLLSKAPTGILLLHNIDQDQWETAMQARDNRMSAKERQYYGSVEVLAAEGGEFAPDAKLIALSQLPQGFDQELMTNLLIYGYALCFGYDPREFWPVSQGSLGTGNESLVQAEKSTGKGQKDFILGFQENLQKELPSTVHFEFTERNEQGELLTSQVQNAKAELVQRLSEMREGDNPVLSNDEIRTLLAMQDLIPHEWTTEEEDVTLNDEQQKVRFLDNPNVRRSCEVFWNEPIIRYQYGYDRNGMPDVKEFVLWQSGDEALKQSAWQLDNTVYQSAELIITEADIKRARGATNESKKQDTI